MIVTRSPLRISLAGGGTDLKSYYTEFEGHVISLAIDKYVYVTLNKAFLDGIRFAYSETETVTNARFLRHRIGKAVLGSYSIESGLEITTVADVPSHGTGLASSSAFTAALIKALSVSQGKDLSKNLLAEKVCNIEIDKLKAPIGKQDQYASVYGGLNSINFFKNEDVQVQAINLGSGELTKFENSIFLIYTGISRSTNDVLRDMEIRNSKNKDKHNSNLHILKSNARDMQESLIKMDLKNMGSILNESWLIKKKINNGATNSFIDGIYQKAIELGVYGGKLLGAGAGGFLFFVCDPDQRATILQKLDCKFILPKIDFSGTSVLYQDVVKSVRRV